MTRAVYVAAPSREIERAEAVIAALRSRGVAISHDWTVPMRQHGPDACVPDSVLLPALLADLERGVFGADFVLLLAPTHPTTPTMGMWVELGAAWAHMVHTVSAGGLTACPWLRALVTERFDTDDQAIAHLVQLVREAA